MSYHTVQLAYEGRVATLTLNRPEKRNAISFELIGDLVRALDEVAKSDAIVLIVTGAGRAFGSEEAARMGLINEIVSAETLMARARELAALLMENSASSLRATKQLLTDHARMELDAHIEAAVRENAAIRRTADFREGIA